ncbi:MAG: MATE family efflux transporter [Faecousia sp.]
MQGELPSQRITEGVIWKQLLSFFFPILLGSFFQQMYNTVDTIIVGRFVGTQALAAVGSTAALLSLMNGFFIGLSTGATVLLSQFYGAKNRQGVQDALHTGVALSLLLGAVVMTLGLAVGPGLLRLMKTPENCMDSAVSYTRIYFTGAIASMLYNMGAGILRAMGDSRKPTVFLMIACVVNIAMDIVCVVVLKLGVAGAAIATVLSQIISAGMVVAALRCQPEDARLFVRKLRLQRALMKRILYIGVPAGLQFVTFDLANILIQSGINSFGDVAVAAWTAYIKTDCLTWMISGAFGVSVTTFVGQNFGAQKYGRIRQSVWICMGMSVALTGTLSALVIAFRSFILGIYTTDPAVIRLGAYVMLWTVPFNMLFMPVEVFAGAMRGTGYSVMPTVITCVCVCLFRVVWIFTVVRTWHRIELLAICYPVSWLLAATVFFITYLRGTWLHRRIAECGMEPEAR